MIKKLILNYKSSSKNARREPKPISYAGSRSVGVLYDAADFSEDQVNRLEMDLVNDGKNVTKMKFAKEGNEGDHTFIAKDVSFFGSIKNETLEGFIRQHFDIIISLAKTPDTLYNFILAETNADFKASLALPERNVFVDMEVKPTNTTTLGIPDLMTYLKKVEK